MADGGWRMADKGIARFFAIRHLPSFSRHVACTKACIAVEETFSNLAAFLNSLDAEGEQKFELSHSLVIICPDCGKNIAFRGRCPKCAGNSWIPAGHSGGIFEQMKAQRLRRMIGEGEDDTLTRKAQRLRGSEAQRRTKTTNRFEPMRL